MIDIGTMLNQRFLLEKELGRGGMGAVYLANDEVLQRKVAIKLLKEQSGDGSRQEATSWRHRSLPGSFMIMSCGSTTSTRPTRPIIWSWRKFRAAVTQNDGAIWRWLDDCESLAQVAEALDYAHHQGVIHRDVKPANVLVTTSDVPKLSDFGLSTIAEQGDQTGVVRGTPHYMSPEQTRGEPAGLPYRPVLAGSDALRVGHGNSTVFRVVDLDHVAALLRGARTTTDSQSIGLGRARRIDPVAFGQET